MKKLIDILLAGAITLGLSGCASTKTVRSFYSKPLNYDNPEYHFKGILNEEQVNFYETEDGNCNVLEVTRKNGVIVKYLDYSNQDFRLERVDVTKDDTTTDYYSNDKSAVEVIAEAQKQFDEYLKKILEAK